MSGIEEARENYSDICNHERCHISANEMHGLCGSFESYHIWNSQAQYVKEQECSCGRNLCKSCIELVPKYFKQFEVEDAKEEKEEGNAQDV